MVAQSQSDGLRFWHFPDPKKLIGDADSSYLAAYADTLSELAGRRGVSVIHASSNFLNGLAAARAARQLGIRSVYEMRGLWHLTRAVRERRFRDSDHYRYCERMEVAAAQSDLQAIIDGPIRELNAMLGDLPAVVVPSRELIP